MQFKRKDELSGFPKLIGLVLKKELVSQLTFFLGFIDPLAFLIFLIFALICNLLIFHL